MRNKSEVDLRVSQELKNNQDFIYQTNQAIQNLRFGLSELNRQNEKLSEILHLMVKKLEINFDNQSEQVSHKIKKQEGVISEHEKTMDTFTKDSSKKFTLIMQNFVEVTEFQKAIERIDQNQRKLEERLNVLNGTMLSSFGLIDGQIKNQIDSVRKDLTLTIPEVNPLEKSIGDKINSVYVDFSGLTKEIAVLKKAVAYDQKKFENVYTLIERLKAGK
jgi:hypothetical protein